MNIHSSYLTFLVVCPTGEMQLSATPIMQVAKAALKQAAGALAEALAERDAAGDERAGIEAQLQAALKSVAGEKTFMFLSACTVGIGPRSSCHLAALCLELAICLWATHTMLIEICRGVWQACKLDWQ